MLNVEESMVPVVATVLLTESPATYVAPPVLSVAPVVNLGDVPTDPEKEIVLELSPFGELGDDA